jgi:hypothetical protein
MTIIKNNLGEYEGLAWIEMDLGGKLKKIPLQRIEYKSFHEFENHPDAHSISHGGTHHDVDVYLNQKFAPEVETLFKKTEFIIKVCYEVLVNTATPEVLEDELVNCYLLDTGTRKENIIKCGIYTLQINYDIGITPTKAVEV